MSRYLICLLALFIAAPCFAQSKPGQSESSNAAPGSNLLSNGDLESLDASGWADGWYRPKGSTAQILDENNNHFARLEVTTSGGSSVMQHETKLDPACKAVELSARVRYADIKRGPKGWNDGRIIVMFLDAAGKNIGKQYVMNWSGSAADWKTQSVAGLVPTGAVKVKIQVALFYVASGRLDIDDLSLTAIDPSKVEPPAPTAAPGSNIPAVTNQPLPYRALESNFTNASVEGKSVAGWSIMAGSPQVVTEADASFIRLNVEHEGEPVQIRRYVPLHPNWGKLTITARLRHRGVKPGEHSWQSACIVVDFLDAQNKRIPVAGEPFRWKGTSKAGWIEESHDYVIPMGAAQLKLDPALFYVKSGTLDLASLSVTITETRGDMVSTDLLPEAWKPATEPHWTEKTATRERICLNGVWKIRPIGLIAGDPRNVTAGLIQNPVMPAKTEPGLGWGYCKIPSTFPGSKENANDAVFPQPWQGVNWAATDAVWYQRDLSIPADWKGRRIVLSLDTVQSLAAVFIGDKLIGSVAYPAGEIDLTDSLTPGQSAVLTILVIAKPFSESRIHAMNPGELYLASTDLTQRGLCGDVFLIAEPAGPRLADVQFRPSVARRQLGLRLQTTGLSGKKAEIRVIARYHDQVENQWTSPAQSVAEDGSLTCEMPWLAAHLWDIDAPNLYDADVALLDESGNVLDEVRQRFGFREITLAGRDILLNGSPIHWRVTKIGNDFAGRSKPQMIATFHKMRELGLNCMILDYSIFPGSAPSYEPMYEAADETGVILVATINSLIPWKVGEITPESRRSWADLARYSVRVAQNHPSVLAYSTDHNRLGYMSSMNPLKVDGLHEPHSPDPAFAEKRKIAAESEAFIRSLDPTREVYHHSSGNFLAWETNNCYLNWMPDQERSDYLEHWSQVGVKPVFFTEYGLPFVATWSRYHGYGVFRSNTRNEPLFVEFGAAMNGSQAYELNDIHSLYVKQYEEAFAKNGFASWGTVTSPWIRRSVEWNYVDIQARIALETFPAMRTYGISALLPWDFKGVADWTDQTPKQVTLTEPAENWTFPGLHPDFAPGYAYTYDQSWFSSPAGDTYRMTSLADAFRKVNADVLPWIAGRPERFTERTHLFTPGQKVTKQVIVINDLRSELKTSYELQVKIGDRTLATINGKVAIAPGRQQRDPFTFGIPADAQGEGTIHLSLQLPDGKTSEDDFAFSVIAPAAKVAVSDMVLWDPKGDTDKALQRIGVNLPKISGKIEENVECLVIGKEAMTVAGSVPDIGPLLARGGRVVVFEQSESVLSDRLGFRTAIPSLRHVFVRTTGHALAEGLNDQMLRDWNGAATLIPPQLRGLPEFEDKYPTADWLGFNNTRVWKVNNWGQVASVMIEKPQSGDFLAIIDGGFDLQYSPLLLSRQGNGEVLFCQMDVSGRTEESPAAERLLANIMRWAGEKQTHVVAPTTYVGDDATRSLIQSLGADATAGELPKSAIKQGVFICGPGVSKEALQAALPVIGDSSATFVFLFQPKENLAVFAPHITADNSQVIGDMPGENAPAEMAGVGPAEMHLRSRTAMATISAVEAGGWRSEMGTAAVVNIGKARCVFLQINPNDFDYTQKNRIYVKLTHNRSSTLLSRVLANVGVTMGSPLVGYWNSPATRAQIDLTKSKWEAIIDKDRKLTPEQAATDKGDWKQVQVPGELEQTKDWPAFEGRYWYRVRFDAPPELVKTATEVLIGRVDDEDATYLNGQKIGHIGQDTHPQTYYKQPRVYAIAAGLLKAKDNVLVIQGENLRGPSGIIDGPARIAPQAQRWIGSYYLDKPAATDDPYRYSRW